MHKKNRPPLIGRKIELELLGDLYKAKSGKIIAVYGRRRIGKSYLIKHFLKDKFALHFEGLEKGNSKAQLTHFYNTLTKQHNDPLLTKPFLSWDEAFNFITQRIIKPRKTKTIIFLDELQWMATGKDGLISLIKFFWDNYWLDDRAMLVLCGSISSFMINKVIKSKALYGRISSEICLKELSPKESREIQANKPTPNETLETFLIFGGIPKYLEELSPNNSLLQNISKFCFKTNGFFYSEYEKIFYSQFKEHRIYERIIKGLSNGPLEYSSISKVAKLPSGGGLSRYIKNLEEAQFIIEVIPFGAKQTSKEKKYQLADYFINFYLKFILPNKKIIIGGNGENLLDRIKSKQLEIFLGIQFEKFCLKHANLLARQMGFNKHFLNAAPYFRKGDKGFQIDILFERSDNIIVLGEAKYSNEVVSTSVVPEVEKKVLLLKEHTDLRIQKALITKSGASKSLLETEYFDYIIEGKDFFK